MVCGSRIHRQAQGAAVVSGSVIERTGHHIDPDGRIRHHDEAVAWPEADKRAGFRLDRRKNWAFVDGLICDSVSWSRACSGCYEGHDGDNAKGTGCSECGYQGRARNTAWVPADAMMEAHK